MKKPLIGITMGYRHTDKEGGPLQPGDRKNKLAASYADAVAQAGGLPLALPVCDLYDADPEILTRLDGILFTGGEDIDPVHYGQAPAGSEEPIPERDRQELYLMRHALTRTDLPILGICRGCQLLNVATGGSLFQDINAGIYGSHVTPGQPENVAAHPVTVTPESLLAQLVGPELMVNSLHHQAVDRLGDGLAAVAADPHGLTEALEMPARVAFTLGVQWHPEGMCQELPAHGKIFEAFVEAAKLR